MSASSADGDEAATGSADAQQPPEEAARSSAPSGGQEAPAPARRTTVLRAFRLGSLLGIVLTGIAAWFFMSPLEAGTDFQSDVLFPMREENRGLPVVLPVVLTGVDLWLLGTRESRRPAARMLGRLVTLVTAIADAAVVVLLVGNWWTTYLKWRANADKPLYLAAGIAFLICFSCGQHLLRSQRSQPRPVLPACRNPLRRFVARVTRTALGTTPVPRSQRRPAMIAFLLPALILPSTALAPPVLTWPDSRLAAAPAPGSPEPALPTTIGSSTAWTRDVGSGMLDIVAGARGPVILTGDGVEGLDTDDGSILWSYHRRYTSYREIHSPLTRGGILERNSMRYLLASPDRRHVALRAITSTTDITIILDTSTGKATAEEPCDHDDALQLTDSAALIEDKAISLADGKTLWTLPDGRGSTHGIYNGTAGHSTFIVDSSSRDAHWRTQTFTLAQDTDPTRTTSLPGVTQHSWLEESSSAGMDYPSGLTVIDGWVGVIAPGTTDEFLNHIELDAINIDDVAASGSPEDARRIPLGLTSGINRTASLASGMLVTCPADPEPDADPGHDGEVSNHPQIGSILEDPDSGTVVPVDQSASLAGADIGYTSTINKAGELESSIVIRPGDGSSTASIQVPPTSVNLNPPEPDADHQTQKLHFLNDDSEFLNVLAAPGVIVVVLDAEGSALHPDFNIYDSPRHATRLYGMK